MKPANHSERRLPPASDQASRLAEAADRLARFNRISWKAAFGGLLSPAMRLHRYRHAHNRLLLDALCARDCGDNRGHDA